jgi:hypothetical protein
MITGYHLVFLTAFDHIFSTIAQTFIVTVGKSEFFSGYS